MSINKFIMLLGQRDQRPKTKMCGGHMAVAPRFRSVPPRYFSFFHFLGIHFVFSLNAAHAALRGIEPAASHPSPAPTKIAASIAFWLASCVFRLPFTFLSHSIIIYAARIL